MRVSRNDSVAAANSKEKKSKEKTTKAKSNRGKPSREETQLHKSEEEAEEENFANNVKELLVDDDESQDDESLSDTEDGGSELDDEGSASSDNDQGSDDGDGNEGSESDQGSDDGDENEGSESDQGSDDGDENEGSEPDRGAEESDSSEDEVPQRNTVGDVPLEWYKDEKHIGYDIAGKKITKKDRQDKLASYLDNVDDSKNWLKIFDEYDDEEVEVTKEEANLIRNLLKGKAPHAEFDPYAPYVDWFKWDDAKHPLSNAPEPKRRFIPSKSEHKLVVKYARAIRKGLIKFDKQKEEPRFYMLWGDDSSSSEKTGHLSYIPAPKSKLPGHEESYNPSLEYIPTQEEINSYQLMDEEDRPQFIPKRFESLRSIPAYENAVKESFERCLDLYLCPRVRKKRINIDPESLKPKLPSRKDLRPYPVTCYLEYKGHKGAVVSISTEASGQWIASGSTDGTVRIWEVQTGRCLKIWEIGEAVHYVSWNPLHELPIVAVAAGRDVFLLNTGLGNEEVQGKVKELLHLDMPAASDDSGNVASSWSQDNQHGGIKLKHFKLRTLTICALTNWLRESKAILIHQLSKKVTQRLPFKLHGLPVSSVFHPTRSIIFAATKKHVRVYDLVKQKLIKKLETGLREVSSIAVHPAGDNIIVGSKEGKLCWFDMDLSSKAYKILRCHPKDITNVAFHRSYPLFASCSDDSTAYVFHGMVYSDLNENPLIVPLQILRGHASSNGRGVMDCKFHPRQPWLFTAGADSLIKLYCH
ncbi:Ribosome biogenesis protein 1 [Turnera subulata]|uniref:Ribosome biogenesis protein BOP1 homolog n=1 Tax=Turnera subulata TaxID=218843 RepID=A0A9Q0J853_9ROSI|nr:Ribosome biogenesis protein 1 [Turnera subulata]